MPPTGGGPARTAGTTTSGSRSTASTATSLAGWLAAMRAPEVLPSANPTWIWVAPSTTCRAVSTAPPALTITPLPRPASAPPTTVPLGRNVFTVTSEGPIVW